MTTKKILGIVLAVLFGGTFVIGLFMLVFYACTSQGYSIWFSALIGASPFIAAVGLGIIALISYLLEDSDNKHSKKQM